MTNTYSPIPATAMGVDATKARVEGLDSIRFVCAFTVMIFHVGLLNDRMYGVGHGRATTLLMGIYNCLFNGSAAVIVFFIISGFCIHYPYRGKRKLLLQPFYTRRFVRILIPASAFLLINKLILHENSNPQHTVLWSVICETIYYAIYPILLQLRRRLGWPVLLTISFVITGVLIGTHLSSLSYGRWGYIALGWKTWIVGLPCWLSGCWLAESYSFFRPMSAGRIWIVRMTIYILTVFILLFRFHTNSFYSSECILLDLFTVPACLWLGCEIAYASQHPRIKLLEWAGGWSYSLYLIHPLVGSILSVIGLSFIARGKATHFLFLAFILLASYVFFLSVERPSHRLAIVLGRLFASEGKPVAS